MSGKRLTTLLNIKVKLAETGVSLPNPPEKNPDVS